MQLDLPRKTFDEAFEDAFDNYLNATGDAIDDQGFYLLETPSRNKVVGIGVWHEVIVKHVYSYLYN